MRRIPTARENELFDIIEPYVILPDLGEMSGIPYRLKSDAPLDVIEARKELLDIESKQMSLARSLGFAC